MGKSWPAQIAQPLGTAPKANTSICPRNGELIA
jgi:hypothetical protein